MDTILWVIAFQIMFVGVGVLCLVAEVRRAIHLMEKSKGA